MSDKIIQFDDALFGSAVIKRCRRRESSVEEALMEMCLAGVSTRGVDDISRLLWGERMPSRTLVDKLKKIYKEIDGWRKRPLESEYPYVFVDGVWRKRSWGGHVENVGVLVAIGVSSRQISFQLGFETALVPIELASAVRERHIREWRVPRQREKCDEETFVVGHGRDLVIVVAVEQRAGMERDVGQGDIREVLFVAFDVGIDRLGLVAEHQGDGGGTWTVCPICQIRRPWRPARSLPAPGEKEVPGSAIRDSRARRTVLNRHPPTWR